MNILKTLFATEDRSAFCKDAYPLVNGVFNVDERAWHDSSDEIAVVKSTIEPGQLGHVKFRGVRWRACCDRPMTILNNQEVRVTGRRANILIVEPLEVSAYDRTLAA